MGHPFPHSHIKTFGNEQNILRRNMESEDKYEQEWSRTWASFRRALRSPDDFNATSWLLRLVKGYIAYLYFKSGLFKLGLHDHWRSSVPFFGLLLICTVLLSYICSIRSALATVWCCAATHSQTACQVTTCAWASVHDVFIAYLGIMIMFHYSSACFRSPGVALSAEYDGIGDQGIATMPENLIWKSVHSRGGCCGFNSTLNITGERRLVAMYSASPLPGKMKDAFPSLEWTPCSKCKIIRPPRCHHCSTCNRCILQFDHHCIWLNNCIGKNNYRNFILLLFFLTIGCWYGVAVLWHHFIEPLREQVNEHGWHIMYDQATGFLNIPPLHILMGKFVSGELESDIIIKLVFPLLVSVGLVQLVFLSFHMRYTMAARTTLEHKILLDKQMGSLIQKGEVYEMPPNPFDRGWFGNIKAVLGGNLFTILLPIPTCEENGSCEKKST